MRKRPIGLTIFAIINFIFAAICIFSLNLVFLTQEPSLYSILSLITTAVLLIISGMGFLSVNTFTGFLGGIAFCIFSVGNIFIYNALNSFQGFAQHIPSLIYPTLLLLMLILRYKKYFIVGGRNSEFF